MVSFEIFVGCFDILSFFVDCNLFNECVSVHIFFCKQLFKILIGIIRVARGLLQMLNHRLT